MIYKESPKLLSQFQYCEAEGIPWLVILGEEEKVKGSVRLRHVDSRVEVGVIVDLGIGDHQLICTPLFIAYNYFALALRYATHNHFALYQKGINSIGKFGG